MDRDRLLSLLDDYHDGRLTADGRAALNAALRDDAEARRLFWECAHQHAMLADLFAERRGRRLAQEETTVPRGQRPALAPVLLALAALLLLAVGLGVLVRPPADGPLPGDFARLDELRGEVVIIGQTRLQARPGQVVRPGEEIRTGEDGFAVVTYPDSSRLELNADTSVRLMDDGPAHKRVFLTEGVVHALVTPQPHGQPMLLSTLQADLLATGNRFSSASVMGETRIEMEQGKALLTRKGDAKSKSIEIEDGIYAVASPDLEVFRPAPMLPAGRQPAAVLEEPSGPVLGLAPLDQARALAIACSNGQVKLWDTKTRQVRGTLDIDRKRALAVAGSPDGRSLAAGYEPHGKGPDGLDSVMVWDVKRREVRRVLAGTRRVAALTFTPDGRTLVFASQARPGVWVWDLPDPRSRSLDAGRERFVLGDRTDRVRALALSPDGLAVAAGLADGRIRLWDMRTGRPLSTLEGHQRDVQTLAYQPGGQHLASGSRDGSVRIWSPTTGEEVRKLTGKFGEVRCLAFSPDGQTLVTGHAGFAILWDVRTGQQRTTLKAHKFAITALVYLHDGRTLATAGWDRTVKLWNLQPATGGPL